MHIKLICIILTLLLATAVISKVILQNLNGNNINLNKLEYLKKLPNSIYDNLNNDLDNINVNTNVYREYFLYPYKGVSSIEMDHGERMVELKNTGQSSDYHNPYYYTCQSDEDCKKWFRKPFSKCNQNYCFSQHSDSSCKKDYECPIDKFCKEDTCRQIYCTDDYDCPPHIIGNLHANGIKNIKIQCDMIARVCTRIKKGVCSEPFAIRGNCYSNLHLWSYDQTEDKCKEFLHGGCGGNGNKFKSYSKCMEVCKRVPVVNDKCSAPMLIGGGVNRLCGVSRWTYNKNERECKEVWTFDEVCEVNGKIQNKFLSYKECSAACKSKPAICPTGWTSLATGCYKFINDGSDQQVITNCKSEGGFLVEVNSQEEQDLLWQFHQDSELSNTPVLLGATDLAKEGEWIWGHSGREITFHAWNKKSLEPNGGLSENCLYALPEWGFKWNDWGVKCFEGQKALCEYEMRGEGTSCMTIGGPDEGTFCVFPFTFRGKNYRKCTVEGANDGLSWCSTLVDRHGKHVGRRGKWGHCGQECRSNSAEETSCMTIGGPDEGAFCVFPFTFRGKTYRKCTVEGAHDGLIWCSTLVDSNGKHIGRRGKWGHCSQECRWNSGKKY